MLVVVSGLIPCGAVVAQGTKLWTVSRYEEMERGTTEGVAIRSDGRIEAGPATSLLYQTGGNYVWSVAADAAGNAYVGMGGTAAGSAVVMRVTPDGKAMKVFEGKELGVQALRVGVGWEGLRCDFAGWEGVSAGRLTAGADAVVVFDAAQTAEKPKYLWDVVQAAGAGQGWGSYVAAGAPAVVYRVPAGGGKAEVAFKTADQHIRCLLMAPDGTLWAGSDGSGVIYKLKTTSGGGEAVCGLLGGEEGDYFAGDGWRGECVRGRRGDEGGSGRDESGAAAVAGDGRGGGDDYVFAAGVGECGEGEYADSGWVGDLPDCGGWEPGQTGRAEG